MPERNLFLVCYDIHDQQVYKKVHRAVKAFAVGGQKSCFECWMTNLEKKELLEELTYLLGNTGKADVFQLSPNCEKRYYGIAAEKNFNPFYIF